MRFSDGVVVRSINWPSDSGKGGLLLDATVAAGGDRAECCEPFASQMVLLLSIPAHGDLLMGCATRLTNAYRDGECATTRSLWNSTSGDSGTLSAMPMMLLARVPPMDLSWHRARRITLQGLDHVDRKLAGNAKSTY